MHREYRLRLAQGTVHYASSLEAVRSGCAHPLRVPSVAIEGRPNAAPRQGGCSNLLLGRGRGRPWSIPPAPPRAGCMGDLYILKGEATAQQQPDSRLRALAAATPFHRLGQLNDQ